MRGHKKRIVKTVQFRHSQRKKAACSLKTEQTIIEYVPAVGAKASATSAVRRDVSERETERLFSYIDAVVSHPVPAINTGS